ncbi:hypothetical protein HG531_008708 [Fusarium graminearum]|nr:hypothetical protein HG531_008708 [Fusarium graminearum]
MSKADPWMGSNMDGFSRVGSRLLVGAMPIEPARAAARSERISACCRAVACDNGINTLRLQNHLGSHSINQHLLHRHIRKILSDLSSDLIPQHHAITLSIALCNNSQMLPRSLLRNLKGKANKPVDGVACEDGDFGSHLPWMTTMRSTALTCVFAFAVLADDDPVKITGLAVT